MMHRSFLHRAVFRFSGVLCGVSAVPPAMGAPRMRIGPVVPVEGGGADVVTREFLKALAEERTVAIFYHGGESPGAFRRFLPVWLFRLRPGGPVYANGRCERRGATRTLRLDRVRLA